MHLYGPILTSHVVTISSGTSTATENVGGKVVNFLAVLVTDNGATSGTGIGGEGNTILQNEHN